MKLQYTKEYVPTFTQIVAADGEIYGLDGYGRVWVYITDPDMLATIGDDCIGGWMRLEVKEVKLIP